MHSLINRDWLLPTPLFRDDNDFRRMRNSVERMFDEPFSSSPALSEAISYFPACDQEETDTHYILSLDVPGIDKDDIMIDASANQLSVSGERREEKRDEGSTERRLERRYGSFCRSFTFPNDVDTESVEAAYDNGVLSIAVPKREETKRSRIEISEGKSGAFRSLRRGKKKDEEAA